jgi:hypothetical protein
LQQASVLQQTPAHVPDPLHVCSPTQQTAPHSVPDAANLVPHTAPLQIATEQSGAVHVVFAPATHVPVPLHVDAALATRLAQDAATHTVPDGHSAHAPPLHLPSVPHVDTALATQMPRGSVMPFVAAAHVPFVPPVRAAEHAWHAPVQAALQQTPSTQKPLVHSSAAVQPTPFACLATHAVPEQYAPAAQAASFAQDDAHAPAPHA